MLQLRLRARIAGRLRHVLPLVAFAVAPLLAQAPVGRAPAPQSSAPASQAVRRVAGQVVMPRDGQVAPVPGIMVTLHRVGPDTAGPIDSTRTRADGGYEFRYRPFGAEEAIYFVSASHAGIAHFSPPLRGPDVRGEDAEITVFDTTTKALGIATRGHHIVVSSTAMGQGGDGGSVRTVVEVYELSNDSSRTMIAGEGAGERPTWTAILPAGARDFTVGQGDVSADAVSFTNGRVLVYAPFAPGLKQISFSYSLPASAFPLRIPVEQPTQVLEVLLEEPRGTATGGGLELQGPVEAEGRTFRRFLAQDVPANTVISIALPEQADAPGALWVVGVALLVGIAMLIGLARAFSRRVRPTVAPRLGEDDPDALAREIAALDAAFERERDPSDESRAAYRERRERLKGRLSDALARRAERG